MVNPCELIAHLYWSECEGIDRNAMECSCSWDHLWDLECDLTEKSGGRVASWRAAVWQWFFLLPGTVFQFSSKTVVYYAFLLWKKLLVDRMRNRGFDRPPRTENVKRMGLKILKVGRGFSSPTPRQLAFWTIATDNIQLMTISTDHGWLMCSLWVHASVYTYVSSDHVRLYSSLWEAMSRNSSGSANYSARPNHFLSGLGPCHSATGSQTRKTKIIQFVSILNDRVCSYRGVGKMRNCGMRNAESKMRNRKLWKRMRNGG